MSSGGKIENILELENLQCSEIKQRSVQGALTTVHLPGMLVEEDLSGTKNNNIENLETWSGYSYSFKILYTYIYTHTGFPGGSDSKESACNVGALGSILGLGRSPGGGHGNPFQYSCLENPHGQRSLVGYSPWGHKESDMTEQLSTHIHTHRCIHTQENVHTTTYTSIYTDTQAYTQIHTHKHTCIDTHTYKHTYMFRC